MIPAKVIRFLYDLLKTSFQGDDCEDHPARSSQLSQLETCRHHSTLVVDLGDGESFEDVFHGAAVVVVCAALFVMAVLCVGVAVFR